MRRHVGDDDARDVFHEDRRAGVRRDDDVADVLRRTQQAEAANQKLLRTALGVTAAGVGVAAAYRGEKLLQCDVVFLEPREVGFDFVLLHQPTHGHHVRDAGHGADLSFHDPVFERTQLARVMAGAGKAIPENFPDGRTQRRKTRLHAWRQVRARESFHHLLPRNDVVGFVVER